MSKVESSMQAYIKQSEDYADSRISEIMKLPTSTDTAAVLRFTALRILLMDAFTQGQLSGVESILGKVK